MDELKPCPFCGEMVEVETLFGYREMTFFKCNNPDCLAYISFNRKYSIQTEGKAVEAWNRRKAMNDYNELIDTLYDDYKAFGEGRTQSLFEMSLHCKDAAYSIEKLVKELDSQKNYTAKLQDEIANLYTANETERKTCDEWQHDYFEMAKKCELLEAERDAAIEIEKKRRTSNDNRESY